MATINIKLSDPQRYFCASGKRWNLWRASRRQGKTNAATYKFAKRLLTNPGKIGWYVAQDAALCKELNIPLFEQIVPHELIRSYSKSDKCFELFNGSKAFYKTANSSDGLRGRKIHYLVGEEPTYWQNGHDIFHNILRPQLADTLGTCDLIFTPPTLKAPKGAEWVRRLEQEWAEGIKNGSQDHAIFYNTIWDSPFIQDEEKKALERSTDPETWCCEYLANYNDKQGQVYWEFDPLIFKRTNTENVLMRVRGADHGVEANTACVWIDLIPDNRVYIKQEYIEPNKDIPTHAIAIKGRTTIPVAWTTLDSACWGRESDLSSPAKRFYENGIPVMPATKDKDGTISDMKRLFETGKIIIDPSCIKLLEAINSWQWGQHEPDVLAAARYGIDGLIRAGKLMRPVRSAKEDTRNVIEKREEMLKRMNRLNDAMAHKDRINYGGCSFKFIK